MPTNYVAVGGVGYRGLFDRNAEQYKGSVPVSCFYLVLCRLSKIIKINWEDCVLTAV